MFHQHTSADRYLYTTGGFMDAPIPSGVTVTQIHLTMLPITPILLLAGAIVALMPRVTVHFWTRSFRWG